ncbi:MAG: hypothetical protein V8S97_07605, partial [Oscillospiraceae bacterium]
ATMYLPLAELVDIEKELERIQKELTKARENLERIEKKLQNESFVSKAPKRWSTPSGRRPIRPGP